MKVCLALNLKYVKPHCSSCLLSSLSSSQPDGLSVISLLLRMYCLDASKSHFVSSLFLISLYLVSHQTLPWFSSCLHLFLLVPFAILVIISQLDYLKVINTFYLAFLFLYFHFQAILHTVSKLILKALMSSCHSLNKNCNIFTLHPISVCIKAPTLSSVFFFLQLPNT